LKRLSVDCNFAAVTTVQHRGGAIRDAFIAGISSASIRQRLLESENLDLQHIFDKAKSLDEAQQNAEVISESRPISSVSNNVAAMTPSDQITEPRERNISEAETVAVLTKKCYFCGNKRHARRLFPFKDAICFKCRKKGHFAKFCRSKSDSTDGTSTALISPLMGIASNKDNNLGKTSIPVKLNGIPVQALLDTGSTNSHVSEHVVKRRKIMYKLKRITLV